MGSGLLSPTLTRTFFIEENFMDRTQQRRGDPARNEQHYRCLNPMCNYEWKEKMTNVDCPRCGSQYLKWINYKVKGA